MYKESYLLIHLSIYLNKSTKPCWFRKSRLMCWGMFRNTN